MQVLRLVASVVWLRQLHLGVCVWGGGGVVHHPAVALRRCVVGSGGGGFVQHPRYLGYVLICCCLLR
jgi:hypothetical protein